jgi:hypothetical protein
LPIFVLQIGKVGRGAHCVFVRVSYRISNFGEIDTCNDVHINLTCSYSIVERAQIDAESLVTYCISRQFALEFSDFTGKNPLQIGDLRRFQRRSLELLQGFAKHDKLIATRLVTCRFAKFKN